MNVALVEEHIEMAKRLAKKFHRSLAKNVPLDDVEQIAMLGLIDAAKKFDPEVQKSFPPYAAQRIRGAIIDGLREMDWAPRSVRRQVREVETALDQGSEVPGDVVSKALAQREAATLVSIEAADVTAKVRSTKHEEVGTEIRAAMALTATVIHRAGPEAIEIMHRYYYRQQKLSDIATEMGLSQSVVSATHRKVVLDISDAVKRLL